jgi:hypothetical protein
VGDPARKLYLVDSEKDPFAEVEKDSSKDSEMELKIDSILEAVRRSIKLRLLVYPELLWDGLMWFKDRFIEGYRAFYRAVVKGQIFPLRLKISDFQEKEDHVNSRMIGKLLGLIVVSFVGGLVFIFKRHNIIPFVVSACVFYFIAGTTALYAFGGAAMLMSLIYFPLGFWKARKYMGLKSLFVKKMDEMTEDKKTERSRD